VPKTYRLGFDSRLLWLLKECLLAHLEGRIQELTISDSSKLQLVHFSRIDYAIVPSKIGDLYRVFPAFREL